MYIESADLSECHAIIRYVNRNGQVFEPLDSNDAIDSKNEGRYALNDCNSETGTWIRLRYVYTQN